MTRITPVVLMCAMLIFVDGGCRPGSAKVKTDVDFDPAFARAGAERPSSTVVEYILIPPDPSRPRWVVVVEPFKVAASGATSGTGELRMEPSARIGYGLASQLLSALNRVGNVVVVDYAVYCTNPEKIDAEMQSGEVGPFLIKGTVTEFHETADLSSQCDASSSIPQGNTISSIGRAVPYDGGIISGVGRAIAYANVAKQTTATRRKGMVGMDIQVINPESGRMLGSFVTEGTFVAVDVTRAKSKFGKTETSSDYASSAIGQAQRVAVNNAIQNIHGILSQASSER